MANPGIKKAVIIVVVTLSAFFVVLLYKTHDPAEEVFPKCPFFVFTGLKCPGCGSQRAVHQLLCLHVGEAFRQNACLVSFLPIILFLFLADCFREKCPKLYMASRSPILSYGIVAVILLWWIVRNFFSL